MALGEEWSETVSVGKKPQTCSVCVECRWLYECNRFASRRECAGMMMNFDLEEEFPTEESGMGRREPFANSVFPVPTFLQFTDRRSAHSSSSPLSNLEHTFFWPGV